MVNLSFYIEPSLSKFINSHKDPIDVFGLRNVVNKNNCDNCVRQKGMSLEEKKEDKGNFKSANYKQSHN